MSFHNILKCGFERMHGKVKLAQMRKTYAEFHESMSPSEYFTSSILPGASRDLFQKDMRIKAYKSFLWQARVESVYEVLTTVATVGPMEAILFKFLKWQGDSEMLNANCSPISAMTTFMSPPREAVNDLIQLMLFGKLAAVSDQQATLHDIAQGQILSPSDVAVVPG